MMYKCITLHNMIADDEGTEVIDLGDEEAEPSSGVATPTHFRGLPMGYNEFLVANITMQDQQLHARLMFDITENFWSCKPLKLTIFLVFRIVIVALIL